MYDRLLIRCFLFYWYWLLKMLFVLYSSLQSNCYLLKAFWTESNYHLKQRNNYLLKTLFLLLTFVLWCCCLLLHNETNISNLPLQNFSLQIILKQYWLFYWEWRLTYFFVIFYLDMRRSVTYILNSNTCACVVHVFRSVKWINMYHPLAYNVLRNQMILAGGLIIGLILLVFCKKVSFRFAWKTKKKRFHP